MTDETIGVAAQAERALRQTEALKSAISSHAAMLRRATNDPAVRSEAAALLGQIEPLRVRSYQLWARLLMEEYASAELDVPPPDDNYARVLERVSQGSFGRGAAPAATAAHLAATEAALGLALPQQLKQLLTIVGNGGFGPGFGILGTLGSRPVRAANPYTGGDEVLYFDMVDAYRQHLAWPSLITPEAFGYEPGTPEWFEPYEAPWPSDVLLLCDLGGGNSVYIRASGEVLFSPMGEPAVGSGFPIAMEPLAGSLREWLEHQLVGQRTAAPRARRIAGSG